MDDPSPFVIHATSLVFPGLSPPTASRGDLHFARGSPRLGKVPTHADNRQRDPPSLLGLSISPQETIASNQSVNSMSLSCLGASERSKGSLITIWRSSANV